MNKKSSNKLNLLLNILIHEVHGFLSFFLYYLKKKIILFSIGFEKYKNRLVKFFIMKRGRYNRPFLHLATMVVMGIGVLFAPFLASTYPIFSSNASNLQLSASAEPAQSVLAGVEVFKTQQSTERDKTINYNVENGDTLSSIATKFGISGDTIRWANNLSETDTLNVGEQLQILPVTGIQYKVQSGDTIYTIAKKFNVDPQKIADFPFNDYANPETFSLVDGQFLIVPDGVQPSAQPQYNSQQQQQQSQSYIATGPIPVSSGGWYWPVPGLITQYYVWYHQALDIAGSVGTPVIAAHSGTVSYISIGTWDTGYGTNLWIDDGDGTKTHYAHLSEIQVHVGQQVSGGQQIALRGDTGNSTGPHTHFEISVNGSLVNPLLYVHQ
jgi:murein DD-endopeptidase MepM/ murein hydrolase activator NlpD